mgnify:FL=1
MKSLTLQLNSLPTGYEWAAFGDDSSLRKLCRERKTHLGVFRKDSASEGLLPTLHGRKKERRNNVGRTGKICGEARKAYKLSLVRNSRYLQL